jgi:hypothetical protein
MTIEKFIDKWARMSFIERDAMRNDLVDLVDYIRTLPCELYQCVEDEAHCICNQCEHNKTNQQ